MMALARLRKRLPVGNRPLMFRGAMESHGKSRVTRQNARNGLRNRGERTVGASSDEIPQHRSFRRKWCIPTRQELVPDILHIRTHIAVILEHLGLQRPAEVLIGVGHKRKVILRRLRRGWLASSVLEMPVLNEERLRPAH